MEAGRRWSASTDAGSAAVYDARDRGSTRHAIRELHPPFRKPVDGRCADRRRQDRLAWRALQTAARWRGPRAGRGRALRPRCAGRADAAARRAARRPTERPRRPSATRARSTARTATTSAAAPRSSPASRSGSGGRGGRGRPAEPHVPGLGKGSQRPIAARGPLVPGTSHRPDSPFAIASSDVPGTRVSKLVYAGETAGLGESAREPLEQEAGAEHARDREHAHADHHRPVTAAEVHAQLSSRYGSRPCRPPSRPKPDSL